MCTVSIVPRHAGFSLVCNRDERLARADAEPPRVHRVAGVMTIWPTDTESGGTWIGVNSRGLAAVVLNRQSARAAGRRAPCSRGTIIPPLLRAGDVHSLVAQAALLTPRDYEPFTLLAVQRRDVAVITSTGSRIAVSVAQLTRPVVFTSSSLGDRLVDGPRRVLFERLVARSMTPLDAQQRYHRHRWPNRQAISVLMSRPGAATVSRTTIDVDAATVSMRYEPLAVTDGRGREPASCHLPLTTAGARRSTRA